MASQSTRPNGAATAAVDQAEVQRQPRGRHERVFASVGTQGVTGDGEYERPHRKLHEDLVHGVTEELSATLHVKQRSNTHAAGRSFVVIAAYRAN